MLIAYARV